jgi:peptidoglycan hydrolase-like protein with peptidoglycan-binding domain
MAFNATILGLKPLAKGTYGDAVSGWQRFLQRVGFPVGTIDGDFGKATDTATRAYQTKNQLKVTGIADLPTYQVALKQGYIFELPGLTIALLLQAMNFKIDEVKDLQKAINTVLAVSPSPKYPSRPALKLDGGFGVGSTRALVEVYRQLDTGFNATITKALSDKTKKNLATDFTPAMEILTESAKRLRVRLSGPEWYPKFPASASLEDLTFPFRQYAKEFEKALKEAGAKIEIANTLRPPERVYLMHYATKIASEILYADEVPYSAGVEIDWVHYTDDLSVLRAQEMVNAYEIAYPPALRSNHTLGRAVDWYVTWDKPIKLKDATGRLVTVNEPRNSFDNGDLWRVGSTYGVVKLAADAPHWSLDGF